MKERSEKERGYALNNEEFIIGSIAVAAPFFNRETRRPVGAVSFDASTINYTLKELETKFVEPVKQLADDISQVI